MSADVVNGIVDTIEKNATRVKRYDDMDSTTFVFDTIVDADFLRVSVACDNQGCYYGSSRVVVDSGDVGEQKYVISFNGAEAAYIYHKMKETYNRESRRQTTEAEKHILRLLSMDSA